MSAGFWQHEETGRFVECDHNPGPRWHVLGTDKAASQREKPKPRLRFRLSYGGWICHPLPLPPLFSLDELGIGSTPEAAYADWLVRYLA